MRAADFLDKKVVEFAPCYLLEGGDGYLMHEVMSKMLSAIPADARDLGYDEFDDDVEFSMVVEALNTVSLLGGKRIVYLRRRKAMTDEEKDMLRSYLANPNLDSVFVVDAAQNKMTEFKQYFFVIDCKDVDEGDMKRRAMTIIGDHDCSIDRVALAKLVGYCRQDYGRIGAEALKLCYYADGGKITAEDVDSLVAPDPEYNAFELADKFNTGDVAGALAIAQTMINKGDSVMSILALLTSTYRRNLHCALSDLSDEDLAMALGYKKSWAVTKTRRSVAALRKTVPGYLVKLKEQTEYLYDLEYKFKSGIISERNALRLALGKLITASKR